MAYTRGEVIGILAAIVDIDPETIDEFVIIMRGQCDDCGKHDAFSFIDSCNSKDAAAGLVTRAFETVPSRFWEERTQFE